MDKFNIKKQINKLYMVTTVGYFQIAGASWVALLALRGFSLIEIGVLESIFHIVSFCFEIPSGVVADVFGRKKTLVMSQVVSLISSILMILSTGFWTVAFAIGFNALSYNLSSGTREALAYDSLKVAGQEEGYNKFASTEMILYRITNSTATLCAGLALCIGYRKAYAIDVVFQFVSIIIACGLVEAKVGQIASEEKIYRQIVNVVTESCTFLRENRRVKSIMIINSLLGAVATLILFFLQAKLPVAGLDQALLGVALFVMGLGAALGGFIGAFSDDFLQVRTDVILNNMIPSEQRATLVSVSSFMFSVVMIIMSTLMGFIMG